MEAKSKIPGALGLPIALVRVQVGPPGQFGRENRPEVNINWELKSSEHRTQGENTEGGRAGAARSHSTLYLGIGGSWEEPGACCLEGPVCLVL